MKNLQHLQSSYEKQKSQFETAKQKRISNRNQEIQTLKGKLQKLSERINELETLNTNEREFESFESFRAKAEIASTQSKTTT